jgi:hypothetical protein
MKAKLRDGSILHVNSEERIYALSLTEESLPIIIDEVEGETLLIEHSERLQKFYNYFLELYGTGLGIENWHQNGDIEPFDNFFDSAEQEME